jgi:hypothetical protein
LTEIAQIELCLGVALLGRAPQPFLCLFIGSEQSSANQETQPEPILRNRVTGFRRSFQAFDSLWRVLSKIETVSSMVIPDWGPERIVRLFRERSGWKKPPPQPNALGLFHKSLAFLVSA